MAVRHKQREPETRLVLDKLSDDVLLDGAPRWVNSRGKARRQSKEGAGSRRK
jgi:hypothetical protein